MWNFLKRVLTGVVFGAVFWGVYLWCPLSWFTAMLVLVAAIIVFFEWKNFYNPHTLGFWLILPLYPLLPFILIVLLNHQPAYRDLLLYLFILAFAHDTGSYIVGVLFGKHRIWPSISPKKTWEGFAGGYVSALIAFYIILLQRGVNKSWLFMLIFTFISCVILFLGDMLESKLKRRAGIKDSGSLLPGHGGFLDRFDGILFAVFFVYLFRNYLITLF
jgi:phosphatidate cytidylyltransferase